MTDEETLATEPTDEQEPEPAVLEQLGEDDDTKGFVNEPVEDEEE